MLTTFSVSRKPLLPIIYYRTNEQEKACQRLKSIKIGGKNVGTKIYSLLFITSNRQLQFCSFNFIIYYLPFSYAKIQLKSLVLNVPKSHNVILRK